jgi:hypothetical protein
VRLHEHLGEISSSNCTDTANGRRRVGLCGDARPSRVELPYGWVDDRSPALITWRDEDVQHSDPVIAYLYGSVKARGVRNRAQMMISWLSKPMTAMSVGMVRLCSRAAS